MKQFLYFTTISLAALFTIFGSLLLISRYTLLQPETYNSALEESGIYQVSNDILQEKVTQGVVTVSKGLVLRIGFGGDASAIDSIFDRILVSLINTLIDQQSGRLVADLFVRINLPGVLQQTAEQWIARDLAWLKGEREAAEIFSYIPEPEAVERFSNSTFTQNLSSIALVSAGYTDLPECQTQDELATNLQLAEQGRILQMTCSSDLIQPVIDEQVSTILPSSVTERIDTGVEQRVDAFGIQPILDTVSEIALAISQLKQDLIELRSYVELSLEYAVGMLLIGFTLAIASMFIIRKQMLVSFFSVYIISGVAILLTALVFRWFFIEDLIAQVSLSNPETFQPALSTSQSTKLSLSIQEFLRQVLNSVVIANIYFSLFLMGVAGLTTGLIYSFQKWLVPYVDVKLKTRTNKPKQTSTSAKATAKSKKSTKTKSKKK